MRQLATTIFHVIRCARPLTNSKKCQECREEAEKTEAIASLVQEEADEPGPKFYTDPVCNYGSM